MKWIIIVYIAMFTPHQEELKINKLVFPLEAYHDCIFMARHINSIEQVGYRSKYPFVRSLFWLR